MKKIVTEYNDIFCIDHDPITANNVYSENIELNDNIPAYIPTFKQIHSQADEIQGRKNG